MYPEVRREKRNAFSTKNTTDAIQQRHGRLTRHALFMFHLRLSLILKIGKESSDLKGISRFDSSGLFTLHTLFLVSFVLLHLKHA